MPSRCIIAALELNHFTAIGNGATAEDVCSAAHGDARTALGLLLKNEDDVSTTIAF